MIINTKGVVATPPADYITTEGKYLFKIEKVEMDGYSNAGNEFVKVTFDCKRIEVVDGKAALSSESYKHQEKYCADENLIWKVAVLRDALKAPEAFDFEKLMGYYVIADVYMREYNGKQYANIRTLSYSKSNEALPPIPEAVEEQQQSYAPVDDTTDEMPF